MKKLLCLTAALLLAASSVSAERIFEFGVDVFAQVDESFMPINDVFVEDLVIDLPAIADSMDEDGFVLDAIFEPSIYSNFFIGGWGVGAALKLDGYANFGIGKGFWEFLAYGNELDTETTVKVSAGAELYAELAVPVKFRFGQLQFKVTPSAFMPIIYIPNPNATVTVKTNSDGTLTAEGIATYTVYTAIDLSKVFTGNWQMNEGALEEIGSTLSNDLYQTMGFDVDAEVTYPLFPFFTIGGYAHIPVIPGRLSNSATQTATATGQVDAILDSFSKGESISYAYTTDFTDLTFGHEVYTVNRPMRFGMMGKVVLPFIGNLFIEPKIGFATRNPFGEDWNLQDSSTLEYSLGVTYSLYNIVNLSLTHEYWNEVFSNYAGVSLNIRVAQLNLLVGTSGSSFRESFNVYGLKAKVGVCIGF